MIRLEEFNEVIESVLDLLDYKCNAKIDLLEDNTVNRASFFGKGKKKQIPEELRVAMASIRSQKETIYNMDGLDFKLIWDFLQFCRWAEKVMFCDNSVESGIYVESDLMQFTERFAVFNIGKSANFEIRMKLEKINNPKYNDTPEFGIELSNPEPKYLNSMTLVITRDFGKKMKNTFIIVNGEVEYHDSSDRHLLSVVSNIISDCMYKKYCEVCSKIEGFRYLPTQQ